jgi:hypothetical protein
MVQNDVFRWLVSIMRERHGPDSPLVAQLEMAEWVNGIALDSIHRNDPDLAVNLGHSIRNVAREISLGKYEFPSEFQEAGDGFEDACRLAFESLSAMLDWWLSTLVP